MTEHAEHRIETARLRRSPRYSVFFVAGAALGILIALVLTFVFDGSENASSSTGVVYSTSQVFGFLCLFTIPVGVAIGGAVALTFDRMLARKTREVRIDHERIQVTEVATESATDEATEAAAGPAEPATESAEPAAESAEQEPEPQPKRD